MAEDPVSTSMQERIEKLKTLAQSAPKPAANTKELNRAIQESSQELRQQVMAEAKSLKQKVLDDADVIRHKLVAMQERHAQAIADANRKTELRNAYARQTAEQLKQHSDEVQQYVDAQVEKTNARLAEFKATSAAAPGPAASLSSAAPDRGLTWSDFLARSSVSQGAPPSAPATDSAPQGEPSEARKPAANEGWSTYLERD